MKKILLVVLLLFVSLNAVQVLAFDNQDQDLGIYESLIPDEMWNNRLYTSNGNNSIYWVIDKVTFDSQNWYIYNFIAAQTKEIDVTALDISDYYYYLDVNNNYIIFDLKTYSDGLGITWTSTTLISIFTTSDRKTIKNINGRVNTYLSNYHLDTIELLITNLETAYPDYGNTQLNAPFASVFGIGSDFVESIILGINTVTPDYVDLEKNIDVYIMNETKLFSFTLHELLYWVLLIGLIIWIGKIVIWIVRAPLKIWKGGLR